MRPHIPHTASEFCATPECGHHYNWHYPGSICAVPDCPCNAYTRTPASTSSRAHIASPQADHIAQILREDRLAKETPVPTTPKRAVIYVAHPQPDLDGEDLFHRTRLRLYALECGYTVDAVITAHDPDGAEHPPVAFQLVRRALKDEDIDVIVLWHRDLNVPDTLTRADLAPVIPQTLAPPTVGSSGPTYPVGSEVLYDDDPGTVREHRYVGLRDAWDALVDFEGNSGWCWESDLTPPHTEGE
jgi:hypothetical protein